jgi:hypothetical protein
VDGNLVLLSRLRIREIRARNPLAAFLGLSPVRRSPAGRGRLGGGQGGVFQRKSA